MASRTLQVDALARRSHTTNAMALNDLNALSNACVHCQHAAVSAVSSAPVLAPNPIETPAIGLTYHIS